MSNFRYFVLLPDVTLLELDGTPAVNRETGTPLTESHVKFIRERCMDPAFVSDTPKDPGTVCWTMAVLVSAQTIIAKTASTKPGDIIDLEESDWQRLKRAVEWGISYNPIGAMSCIPFMRAITGAATERPKKT